MNDRKAIIVGLSSYSLKKNEKSFLLKHKPWGVILFSRNISSIDQARKLVIQIRNCFCDSKYPILIDEEGGRVSRLKKIIDTKKFTSSFFSKIYNKDKKQFFMYYQLYINSISSILRNIGININTVPVLDVRRLKTNKIIGDRAFSNDYKTVSKLGNYCIDYYTRNKIANVIKHIPGHGLAEVDSHKSTPDIALNKKSLNKIDFSTFKNKKALLAMTAHVIYSDYDKINTATHSKIIINNVIRKKINFKNIIISDDISMKALKYSFKTNILKAYGAGCNLILHCNGNINEMNKLANISPLLNKFIQKKTKELYKLLL